MESAQTEGNKTRSRAAAILTARGIAGMEVGEWAADPAARGAGRLQVRKLAGGQAAFYYRYTGPDGARVRLPIGSGIDLREARACAAELSKRYQAGDRDLRAVIDEEQREADRARRAAAAAEEAEREREQNTLGALLTAYVAHLESRSKASAKDVAASLRLHVERPWPKLWATPADDLTADDLLPVLERITDAGKLRTAGQIRSYLRAAYAAGMAARTKAGAPALRKLCIRTNPARDLGTIEGGAGEAGERALSRDELRAYWRRIRDLPDDQGACLRFHLLTGGQRLRQLARLTLADYDRDLQAITILDGKGRRSAPRRHVVPLIPAAVEAMEQMIPEVELLGADGMPAMTRARVGEFLFTATAGEFGMWRSTVSDKLRPVVQAMLDAGELPGGPFTLGDIRRTVETRLADLRIHSDDRAQLQSHGLGGIQTRHYDRHGYMDEKREALGALYRLLTVDDSAKIVPMARRARGRGRA